MGEGLKPMVDKIIGTADVNGDKATFYVDDEDESPENTCTKCGKWLDFEAGNTGTVCGACTQSMIGMNVVNPNDYGASNLTANSHVGLNLNGHNMNVSVYRSLQGLADDITNSMLPDEVRLLAELLLKYTGHPSKDLPDAFWDAIKAEKKIPAIKELRAVSALHLRSCRDIVEAILDKPKDEDKSEDESEDKDEDQDDKDGSGDKPEDAEPEQSDEGEPEDGDSDGDGAGADDMDAGADEVDASEAGDDGGELDSESGIATAEAIADLARKAHDNGKEHSEDEIREALKTLGIQF